MYFNSVITTLISQIGLLLALQYPAQEVVKVTVFYESLCPDCINFFIDQITPTWKSLYDYITLDLIPYGHAKQSYKDGKWTFTCQHGERECYGNKIQACAIYKLQEKQQKSLYKFLTCFMSSKYQDLYGPICAQKSEVDFEILKKCANSGKGDTLLARYGNRTHNFKPTIKWVPSVVINDVYNKEEDKEATENLKAVICRHIKNKPTECSTEQLHGSNIIEYSSRRRGCYLPN